MNKIKITVVKVIKHQDLIDKYENPILHACSYKEGDYFILKSKRKPKDICLEAWKSLKPFAYALLDGKENFFDGWMKNSKSAMVSCNDGFRPVSFYLEVID